MKRAVFIMIATVFFLGAALPVKASDNPPLTLPLFFLHATLKRLEPCSLVLERGPAVHLTALVDEPLTYTFTSGPDYEVKSLRTKEVFSFDIELGSLRPWRSAGYDSEEADNLRRMIASAAARLSGSPYPFRGYDYQFRFSETQAGIVRDKNQVYFREIVSGRAQNNPLVMQWPRIKEFDFDDSGKGSVSKEDYTNAMLEILSEIVVEMGSEIFGAFELDGKQKGILEVKDRVKPTEISVPEQVVTLQVSKDRRSIHFNFKETSLVVRVPVYLVPSRE